MNTKEENSYKLLKRQVIPTKTRLTLSQITAAIF